MSSKMSVSCLGIFFILILISCGKVPQGGNPENPTRGTGSTPGPKPPQGWDVGSGGDGYAAEFKDIGRIIVRRLKGRGVREVEGISVTSFEEISEKLEVKTTEAILKIGNKAVDALNYVEQMGILLSLVHWANSMDFFRKIRLVIHEILGLMRKDDSGYRLTSEFLKALGFLHDVWFDEFNVAGQVAKTIVEKMPWHASEVSEVGDKDIRETRYFAKREGGGRNYIECKRLQYLNLPDKPLHFICWFGCQTTVSDIGTILIKLGPAWSEENRHPLWRLFDGNESFDYGVVKGDRTNFHQLEIFP